MNEPVQSKKEIKNLYHDLREIKESRAPELDQVELLFDATVKKIIL